MPIARHSTKHPQERSVRLGHNAEQSGAALQMLGERKTEMGRLEEAATAYRAALQEFSAEGVHRYCDLVEENLDRVLRKLHESGAELDAAPD